MPRRLRLRLRIRLFTISNRCMGDCDFLAVFLLKIVFQLLERIHFHYDVFVLEFLHYYCIGYKKFHQEWVDNLREYVLSPTSPYLKINVFSLAWELPTFLIVCCSVFLMKILQTSHYISCLLVPQGNSVNWAPINNPMYYCVNIFSLTLNMTKMFMS